MSASAKMKCTLSIFTALLVACFALVACSSGDGSASDDNGSEAAPAQDTAAPAASASSSQTITFPAAYFPDQEDHTAQLEALGCTDIVNNGDGSYTASVSADVYNQIVSELYDQVVAAAQTLESDPTYPNVESVVYDEGFTTIEVRLNTDMPGIEDTYALPMMGVPAATYQQVAGLPVGCEVSLVLQDGTVQQSSTYPV